MQEYEIMQKWRLCRSSLKRAGTVLFCTYVVDISQSPPAKRCGGNVSMEKNVFQCTPDMCLALKKILQLGSGLSASRRDTEEMDELGTRQECSCWMNPIKL